MTPKQINDQLNEIIGSVTEWRVCQRRLQKDFDIAQAELIELRKRVQELEEALRRMLLEFDFLVEAGELPDIRDDLIFDAARAALAKEKT
jgi:hypothetical protein